MSEGHEGADIWKKRVQEALADCQQPLVVYCNGMAGDDEHGLEI